MKAKSRSDVVYWSLFALALVLSLACLYWAFFQAGLEASMGVVQKIFYFHVPTAIAMQGTLLVCAGASVVYLINHSPKADRLAIACAEIGVLMAAFVLITGPLWARKAWGHYWEWEPRLTLTMVVCFMYVAYIALRSFGGDDPMTKRIGAGLAISGAPALYLVRIAVQRWRGTHPRVVWRGGLQDPDMKLAFWLGVAAFACLSAVLVWHRVRLEAARAEVDDLALELMERDLLEEDA